MADLPRPALQLVEPETRLPPDVGTYRIRVSRVQDGTTENDGDVAEALRYIAEDIRIHEAWLAYVEGNPEAAAQPVRQVDTAGDGDHHREWIRRLEVVRAVLERKVRHG